MTYIKIIEQPENATICEGTEYTLKVVTEPQGLAYQWYFNDTPINGATSSNYRINSINKENAGIYHVVIKSLTGEQVESTTASIDAITVFYASDFQFAGIPEKLNANEIYTVVLEYPQDESLVIDDFAWTFSNDLVTITPGETANSIYLTTDSIGGTGTLSVEISYLCGKFTVEKNIEINNPTGLIPFSINTFTLYPNPVSDVLTISDDAGISSVIITDVNGRTIYTDTNFNKFQTINTSSWSKGIYFVRLLNKNEAKAGKLLKN
jgi:hypothetical protein